MIKFRSAPQTRIEWCAIAAIVAVFYATSGEAATYYASPSGNGTTCSNASPCTVNQGLTTMAANDSLILKDGTYSSNAALSGAKNGTGGSYTVIKAENGGGAIITQAGSFSFGSGKSYIQVEGIRFTSSSGYSIDGANHIRAFRCGFKATGPTSGNTAGFTIGTNNQTPGASYVLLEDCWVWGGGGRYAILVYNAVNVVLRRVVVRTDSGWNGTGDGAPVADIAVYDSQYVAVQNCISADSIYKPVMYGVFYSVCNGTTSTPNSYRDLHGNIIINAPSGAAGLATEGQCNVSNQTVYDMAIVGAASYGISQLKGTSVNYRRVTIASSPGTGIGVWGGSASAYDFVSAGVSTLYDGLSPSTSATYSTLALAKTAGLWYPTRIESGSTLSTGGTYGQRGANVKNRIGTSGTFYNETGFNTDTGVSLWPWPDEARIKTEMCDNRTNGFCAATSLTDYIWTKLGNTTPFGGGGGGKNPNSPTDINVQ